jgi:aminopeptidase YwaD
MAAGEVTATVSIVYEMNDSRNVIAEMPGKSDDGRVVVLGAHYDTVPDTQGANDNGSGLATLMTIAREVAGKSYPFGLRFIAFGAEEVGLFGSRFYVGSLGQEERESIVAMLNFDVPGSGEFPEVIGSRDLVDEALAHGAANGIEVHRGVPLEGASSDHAPFRDVGIPTAFFLADDLERINSTADTLEFVRPELLGISAFLGLGVLDSLADRYR